MLGFLLGLFNAGRTVANDVGNNIENSFRGEIAAKSQELYYWDTNGQQRHTKTGRRCYVRDNEIHDAKTGRLLETIPEKPNAVKCIQQLDIAIGGANYTYPCRILPYHTKTSVNEMAPYGCLDHEYNLPIGKYKMEYGKPDYHRDVFTGRECVYASEEVYMKTDGKYDTRVKFHLLFDKENGHVVGCMGNDVYEYAYKGIRYGGGYMYDKVDTKINIDPSFDVYKNGVRATFDVEKFNKFQDEYFEKNGFHYLQHRRIEDDVIEYDYLNPKKIESVLYKARKEDNKHHLEEFINVEYVGELPEINLNAGTKKKILVCDSVSGYVNISLGFKHLGYEYECLECVDNEEAAVQKCSEIMPDIAYIRLHMLECDGIRCIKRLRKIKPDIKIVLIYILSSHKNEEGYWMEKLWEEQVEVQDIIPCEPSESRLKLCLEKQVREECKLPKEHWLAPDFYEK